MLPTTTSHTPTIGLTGTSQVKPRTVQVKVGRGAGAIASRSGILVDRPIHTGSYFAGQGYICSDKDQLSMAGNTSWFIGMPSCDVQEPSIQAWCARQDAKRTKLSYTRFSLLQHPAWVRV
ncbi:hypothetical protein DSO57_1009049 [Entomophthora muscae]|uniref:Uncharacterized protein n=1 Tax=Entomophthora muscae TaxID=34485 RepID=A0ACC2RLP6_9FUNG|nr:hypothetical protein DSO57_1009049 [Entomophthora muscae]